MRLFVYNHRDFDEKIYFEKYAQQFGAQLGVTSEAPTVENAHLAKGYPYISIITSPIDRETIQALYHNGVRMISTRTIGYDHIDMDAARQIGMKISNATYAPEGVADYTIMLMLMSIRRMNQIMRRADIQDYTLPGIQGREMHNLTVGVIGTGRIGRTVIRQLQGFGCEILAYDLYPNDSIGQMATYVSLDELLVRSDIISLHMPLTKDNEHMIDANAISKMKDGVIIVNTGRGGIIDSQSLIEGIESGKIAQIGLDVVEHEVGLYYFDLRSKVIANRELAILRNYPNSVVTPHMAFYTDQAVNDMVYSSVYACEMDEEGRENPYLVK